MTTVRLLFMFFFQAEDGIRDYKVTGVQTCALPIYEPPDPRLVLPDPDEVHALVVRQLGATALFAAKFRENAARSLLLPKRRPGMRAPRSEERRVGKECRSRWTS